MVKVSDCLAKAFEGCETIPITAKERAEGLPIKILGPGVFNDGAVICAFDQMKGKEDVRHQF